MNPGEIVHDQFVIERVYPATPADVFAAWADPDIKAQWFIGPPGWRLIHRELDFRSGGEEVLHGKFARGESLYRARYHFIEPDAWIVYDYDMWLDGNAHSASLATVTLEADAKGDATRLLFTEQVAFVDGTSSADSRRQGTAQHLDRIGALFSH